MKIIRMLLLGLMLTTLFGCPHPIDITPNLTKIERESGLPPKINAKVGFFIPDDLMNLEAITPGGGGDFVSYYPYKYIESGYQQMLLNVFEKAIKLRSKDDKDEISKGEIKFVLTPVLVTTSGSSGFMTWPPTHFTVDLENNLIDATGNIVGNPRVVGVGQAPDFSDRNSDRGLAGRRAMEDALLKMQRALLQIKYENIPDSIAIPNKDYGSGQLLHPKDQASSRLEKLKGLFDNGLITIEEYNRKKNEILENL